MILNAISDDSNGDSKTDEFSLSGSESFLGHCRYLDIIKETRFGSTILVENRMNKRLYVIKKHSRGDTGRKEATILKSLKHKNITNIYGCGGDTKSTVIISEYNPGGSLADRMIRRYSWQKAFKIILEVAAGLDFAHKNNIVHGNLRPSNILFDSEDMPKISDFGLPNHYDEPRRKNWYMAPERKNSKQADIYALGVILHRMILGRNPDYDAASNLQLSEIADSVPGEVVTFLKRFLAIRVSQRYKSCEEFILDWDDFDQRRREEQQRKKAPRKVVAPVEKPKSQVWRYIVFGVAIIILELVVLFFSGMFK